MWLFLFLLLIPTQLGKYFWPEWSYVLGIRVDYLSPTLYLLDLVWVGLLVEILKSKVFQVKNIFNFKTLLILGFVGINILVAVSPWVALYKWLRLGQTLITFFYFKKNKELVKNNLIKIIPCWIFLESFLALGQMANNGSLNGIFYWLGERSFTFNTIGIAQMSIMGKGLIRAYGTFSHPNSLAGFLLVSLVLWWWLKPIYKNIFWWIVVWLGILGIMVSGSRTIWLLTAGIFLTLLFLNIKNKVNIIGLFLLFLAVIIFGLRLINKEYPLSGFLGGWDRDGIQKRMELNMAGFKMIKESLWFGAGLGNFVVRLPDFQKNRGIYWLQPAHNLLILVWSQVGTLGLFLVFWFFEKNIWPKKISLMFKIILVIMMISGLVDHYWLTLPQNVWLLVLVLSLLSSSSSSSRKFVK